MMFGIKERPIIDGNKIIPFEKYGIKLMSLGFILETDTPVIWRGRWSCGRSSRCWATWSGAPSTISFSTFPRHRRRQLTVTQKVPLAGAVIVTPRSRWP